MMAETLHNLECDKYELGYVYELHRLDECKDRAWQKETSQCLACIPLCIPSNKDVMMP